MQKYGAAPASQFDAGNLQIDAFFPKNIRIHVGIVCDIFWQITRLCLT